MIPVLYEDEYYVIVDKPAKMLVHRTALSRDKVFLLQELRNQVGMEVFPVHRLDRPTSGLIIFAKSKEALVAMSKIFMSRDVEKVYWAVVRGWVGEGVVDKPLKKVSDSGELLQEFQDAKTVYSEIARYEFPFKVEKYPATRYSLVEIRPETGRYHQIRRHFKSVSHPLIGDTKYGKSAHNSFLAEKLGFDRLMLMAKQLRFKHPFQNREVCVEIENDRSFDRFIDWASPWLCQK